MNEKTDVAKERRNRNSQCPNCAAWFTSRKSRHTHQMQAHRAIMNRHKVLDNKIKPASELYGEAT